MGILMTWTLAILNSNEIPNPGNGPLTFHFDAARGGWVTA